MKSERGMSGIGSARRAATMVRLGLVLLALGAAARAGFSQCQYELLKDADGQPVIIQAPPCGFLGPPATIATGMSSNGNLVGYYHDCSVSGAHWGFFWSPETGFVTLPKPANVFALQPSDVTDAGLVVGTANITGLGNRGFLYDINNPGAGNYIYLPPKNGVGNSSASAINESNVIAGSRSIGTEGINPFNAVIWEPLAPGGAIVTDLGVINGPNSSASDGNRFTDAAGWYGSGSGSLNARAVLWHDFQAIELGVPAGAVQSQANTVNDALQVGGLGFVSNFGPAIGFLWSNGTIVELIPPEPYDRFGPGDLIATTQQMVGILVIDGKPGSPATFFPGLWQHGNFYNVSDLTELPDGLVLKRTKHLIEDGRILCEAALNGRAVAVVLRPVGQPPTDLNHDCRVDHFDLLILLDQWGPVPRRAAGGGLPSADFNQDGRVDVRDLLILLSNWG